MLLNLKIKPNSNIENSKINFLSLQICYKNCPRFADKQEIQKLENNTYLVHLKAEPKHNKANLKLINLLSKYFSIPIANIKKTLITATHFSVWFVSFLDAQGTTAP